MGAYMKFRRLRFIIILIIIILIFLKIKTIWFGRNIIVIDPGHGGHDSGAIGINGSLEKDLSLEISKKLNKKLRLKGYKTILTRKKDQYMDNVDRAELSNRRAAKVFISI